MSDKNTVDDVMVQYIGVKVIGAKPMTRDKAQRLTGRDFGGDKTGDGYLVVYDDGYEAWSPKDVFDEAYQMTYPDDYEFNVGNRDHYVDFQLHVIDEFDELFDKSQKLAKFITTRTDDVGKKELARLEKQLKVMVMYRDVLYDRITHFGISGNFTNEKEK